MAYYTINRTKIYREKNMFQNLKNELAIVSTDITGLITEDPFPESIQPSCLAAAVRAYPVRGGKRIRPALLLWANGALEGDPGQALYAGCAVELFHTWTLVHDDIIDEDDFRRGKPTTHIEVTSYAENAYEKSARLNSKFGHDMAILCGDIQQAWAMNMLLKSREKGVKDPLIVSLMQEFQMVNNLLISGEALDVEFPMRSLEEITKEEVKKMILGKTACLLKFSVQCGGAIALGKLDLKNEYLSALGSFAEDLGIAFQLRDDYLGIFGSVEKFGKPIGSDFQEGKPTFLYLDALSLLPESGRKRLKALTGLAQYSEKEITEIRTLLHDSGAEAKSLQEIAALTEKAHASLMRLPENKYRRLLEDLLSYLLERTV